MGEGGGGEEKGSFSPSALSLFRFHLSPFPPETPNTQLPFIYCVTLNFCASVILLTMSPDFLVFSWHEFLRDWSFSTDAG